MNTHTFTGSLETEIQVAREYVSKHKNRYNATEFFPCELNIFHFEGRTVNQLTIEPEDGFFFFELLAKHGFYGNGYCWEDLVEQLLERDLPEMLEVVDFDSEGDTFVAYLDTEENMKRLARYLHDICTDHPRFEQFLREVDRDRIDD